MACNIKSDESLEVSSVGDEHNRTRLLLAVEKNEIDKDKQLLENPTPNEKLEFLKTADESGRSALSLAIHHGQSNVTKILQECMAPDDTTTFHSEKDELDRQFAEMSISTPGLCPESLKSTQVAKVDTEWTVIVAYTAKNHESEALTLCNALEVQGFRPIPMKDFQKKHLMAKLTSVVTNSASTILLFTCTDRNAYSGVEIDWEQKELRKSEIISCLKGALNLLKGGRGCLGLCCGDLLITRSPLSAIVKQLPDTVQNERLGTLLKQSKQVYPDPKCWAPDSPFFVCAMDKQILLSDVPETNSSCQKKDIAGDSEVESESVSYLRSSEKTKVTKVETEWTVIVAYTTKNHEREALTLCDAWKVHGLVPILMEHFLKDKLMEQLTSVVKTSASTILLFTCTDRNAYSGVEIDWEKKELRKSEIISCLKGALDLPKGGRGCLGLCCGDLLITRSPLSAIVKQLPDTVQNERLGALLKQSKQVYPDPKCWAPDSPFFVCAIDKQILLSDVPETSSSCQKKDVAGDSEVESESVSYLRSPEKTKVQSEDVQAVISAVANEEENNFSYLTRMLGEIDFEMSEGDHIVYVYSPKIPPETEHAILKHYKEIGIKCSIFKYDTESMYLEAPRNIEDGVMSPYYFCVKDNQRESFGTGGIPLIHCDESGDNAKCFFLSCAHLLYESGGQRYITTPSTSTTSSTSTTQPPRITVDMISSLQNKSLSITATNSTVLCVDFVIEPEFCCLTNNLAGNEGDGWAMDFFLGRMRSDVLRGIDTDVCGMSDLICPFHIDGTRTMRVKGIEKITDVEKATKELRSKRLYHGGSNMAIGLLSNVQHANFGMFLGKSGQPRDQIKYSGETLFVGRFDVPLLPGHSGSMIYVQEDEEDDTDDGNAGLRVFGIAFATRWVEEEGIGKFKGLYIQPLFPILSYLETLEKWKNGRFWTPYEFTNKKEFRGKKVTF